MGRMLLKLSVSVDGPLARGEGPAIIHEWLDESKKAVAQQADRYLQAFEMDKTGRATGHYQEYIRNTLIRFNDVLVHDPVVYGPWLEGTSRRNLSTHFKGYRLWRLTKLRVRRDAPQIAQDRLPPYLRRLEGA